MITLEKECNLEELKSLIYLKLDGIINEKDLKNENLIKICFPHFRKDLENNEISLEKCPICGGSSENDFCFLPKEKSKISELTAIQYKGRFLILYAIINSPNSKKNIYSQLTFSNESINISQLLDSYFEKEITDNDNKVYCEVCGINQIHERKLNINISPQYLILHVVRAGNNLNKIGIGLNYPIILDIKEFVSGPTIKNSKYNLYGVIVHEGFNLNSGHYYAYCKNNEEWFKFNDSIVTKLEHPFNSDAYILFYEKESYDNLMV